MLLDYQAYWQTLRKFQYKVSPSTLHRPMFHSLCFVMNARHSNRRLMSHFGACFDSLFALSIILECGIKPKVLPQGQGVLSVVVKEFNLHFMDSYRFFPDKLANLPKRFDLPEEKGNYSHQNNVPSNWNRVRKHPPACHLYINHGDTEKARAEKKEWWTNIGSKISPYDFNLDTLQYCRRDVLILTAACCKFLKQSFEFGELLIKTFGISPIWKTGRSWHYHPFNFATVGGYG